MKITRNIILMVSTLTALLCCCLIGVGFFVTQHIVKDGVSNKFAALRHTKQQQVEWYFDQIKKQFLNLKNDSSLRDATKEFKNAWENLEQTITEEQATDIKTKAVEFYKTDFIKRIQAYKSDVGQAQIYMPESKVGTWIQNRYIFTNPYPFSKKKELQKAPDEIMYNNVHHKYHKIFADYANKYTFYDVFIVDHLSGNILYTVEKEVDFGTNLLTGPYKNSALATAFKEAAAARDHDFIKFVDFEEYDPSLGAPAAFLATPIFEGSTKIGVLCIQISLDVLNTVMTFEKRWNEVGLEKTGEAILLGNDYKLRTLPRTFLEDPERYYKQLIASGTDAHIVNKIKLYKTPVLFHMIKTPELVTMLQQKYASKNIDLNNDSVYATTIQLDIPNVTWFMLITQSAQEISAPLWRNFSIQIAVGLTLFLLLVILFLILLPKFLNPTNNFITETNKNSEITHEQLVSILSECTLLKDRVSSLNKKVQSATNADDESKQQNIETLEAINHVQEIQSLFAQLSLILTNAKVCEQDLEIFHSATGNLDKVKLLFDSFNLFLKANYSQTKEIQKESSLLHQEINTIVIDLEEMLLQEQDHLQKIIDRLEKHSNPSED